MIRATGSNNVRADVDTTPIEREHRSSNRGFGSESHPGDDGYGDGNVDWGDGSGGCYMIIRSDGYGVSSELIACEYTTALLLRYFP